MKKIFLLLFLMFINLITNAQSLSLTEGDIENNVIETVDTDDNSTGNSGTSIQEQFDDLKVKPTNLNQISGDELAGLFFLSANQINTFMNYRNSVGHFIDYHELQTLPGWDLALLRKIRPYVYVSTSKSLKQILVSNFRNQKSFFLMRFANSFLRTDSLKNQSLAFRYNYDSRKNISIGLIGENDPGEIISFEKNKIGFDFTSGYISYKGKGLLKSIIVGDYVINLGQGLIHWQSAGFSKGTSVDCIKRQGLTLKPYCSFSEFNFHRGIAIQVSKKNYSLVSFFSSKNLDGYTNFDSTEIQPLSISSFDYSGLHNSISSIQRKCNTHESITGSAFQFQKKGSLFGINFLHYGYSLPIISASSMPYSLFSFKGRQLTNFSFNYSKTINNFHFFGEIASDLQNIAVVNGAIIAVSEKADLCFLQRSISRSYHSFYSNAFTSQSKPFNESGFYSGLSVRTSKLFQFNGYIDFYKFPWLKYSINSPSGCAETGFSLQYLPTKKSKLNFYYAYKKDLNFQVGPASSINNSGWLKNSFKMDSEISINSSFSMKSRFSFSRLKTRLNLSETGVLSFVDIHYKPPMKLFSAVFRIFIFETNSYDSRIYAYENDLMYTFTMNSFYGSGKGFYFNTSCKINKQVKFEAKWSFLTGSKNDSTLFSELKKSQMKLQISAFF